MTLGIVNFCSMADELRRISSIQFGAWRHRHALYCCTAAACAAAWSAVIFLSGLSLPAAAGDRPVKLHVDITTVSDANVFRVPDSNTDPQLATRGLSGRSDRSSTVRFGLRGDKSYGLQRFTVDVGQSSTKYDKFKFLDREAFNYQAAWYWQLTPRLTGALSTDRSESLTGFDDTQTLAPNFRVSRNQNFSVDAWLFGGWHLTAGASESEQKSTSAFAAQPDSTQTSGEFGAKYIAASGNSLSFTQRLREGKNAGAFSPASFIDNQFTVRESELAGAWTLSGKSSLNGRLTRISREHPNIPQRDFSGYAGELRYQWTPTGKLAVNASANRNLISFTPDTSTSYRVDDTFSVSPVWTVASHTSLSLTALHRTSNFLGPVVPVAGPPRRDTQRMLQLAVSWTPHAKVTFRASVQHDRRQSNDPASNYDDVIANLSALLVF